MLVTSCQPTKHVPEGEYLLNKVKIEVDNKSVKPQSLKPYLRQTPNHKTFGVIGLPLAFYNMSGTKDNRWNRFMRKIGAPPVIYDSTLTEIIFTNSIPYSGSSKATILPVASLFADTIRRIHNNESISSQYLLK